MVWNKKTVLILIGTVFVFFTILYKSIIIIYMNRRVVKQIVIALIYLLILFGIGFLIYQSKKPKPTCFDGIRNQEETEIDCGGSCLPCELVYIKEIEVISTKIIPNQGVFYDFFAQIKNPNQNYGSGNVPYELSFYDSQNKIVAQDSGSTFILPNQTKYFVRVKIESGEPISFANLSFGQIEWEKMVNYQSPELVIQQKEYRLLGDNEPGFSQARGVLINKTNFDFEEIDIDVLLFDSSYQLIGVGATKIKTLLAGEEREFVVIWFSEIGGKTAFMEIEAETNLFNPDNYIPVGGGAEKFQEY